MCIYGLYMSYFQNKPEKVQENTSQGENEIFVGGISPHTDKEVIDSHFSKYGELSKMVMPFDRETKRYKGFAFIGFKTAEAQTSALSEDHEVCK